MPSVSIARLCVSVARFFVQGYEQTGESLCGRRLSVLDGFRERDMRWRRGHRFAGLAVTATPEWSGSRWQRSGESAPEGESSRRGHPGDRRGNHCGAVTRGAREAAGLRVWKQAGSLVSGRPATVPSQTAAVDETAGPESISERANEILACPSDTPLSHERHRHPVFAKFPGALLLPRFLKLRRLQAVDSAVDSRTVRVGQQNMSHRNRCAVRSARSPGPSRWGPLVRQVFCA